MALEERALNGFEVISATGKSELNVKLQVMGKQNSQSIRQ